MTKFVAMNRIILSTRLIPLCVVYNTQCRVDGYSTSVYSMNTAHKIK